MNSEALIAAYRLRARAEADYLPPCPACSGPEIQWPTFWYGRHSERWTLSCGSGCEVLAIMARKNRLWVAGNREDVGAKHRLARRWRAARKVWYLSENHNLLLAAERVALFANANVGFLPRKELDRCLAALEHPCPTP